MGRILFGALLICGGLITVHSAFVAPERFHDAALARWLPLVVYGIPGILLIVSGIRSRKKRKPSEGEASAPVVTAALKECPDCHKPVESEARFCSRCGHSFEAPGKTPQQEVSKDQPPRIPDTAPQNPQTLQCAKCRQLFEWHDVYWQEQTPGRASAMFGDFLPRTFCPRCGALVTQYDPATDKWLWVEGNKALNQQKPFPPEPILRTPGMNWWWDRRLPDGAVVPYSKNSLDLSLLESTPSPPAPAARPEAGEDAYYEKCLNAQFKEEDEPRTWRSDPAFRRVLDPLNAGDYKTVCAESDNLLGAYRDFHLIYGWWATALLRMGFHEKARDVLRQGLEKSRRKFFLCKVFGEVEWKSGNLQEALYWWAQALHNQETLENRGNDESAYLYLHYVAQGMGQPEIASAFLARVDRMRPGQIRLVESDASGLCGLARDARSASAEKVLQKLRDRYFLSPQPAKTLTGVA